MIWNSWNDFFAMGGYALYVWGSVTVVAVSIAGEVIEAAFRRRNILQELRIARDIREHNVQGRQ
jgi:heme exporter protein D